jgi:hypothetical protein
MWNAASPTTKYTLVTIIRVITRALIRRTALLSSVYHAPNHVAARQFGLTEMLNRAYNRRALREHFPNLSND